MAKWILALSREEYERLLRLLKWANAAAMEPGPPDHEKAELLRGMIKRIEGAD